jgi:hypothetical protein
MSFKLASMDFFEHHGFWYYNCHHLKDDIDHNQAFGKHLDSFIVVFEEGFEPLLERVYDE